MEKNGQENPSQRNASFLHTFVRVTGMCICDFRPIKRRIILRIVSYMQKWNCENNAAHRLTGALRTRRSYRFIIYRRIVPTYCLSALINFHFRRFIPKYFFELTFLCLYLLRNNLLKN